jgi:hypothetical protein
MSTAEKVTTTVGVPWLREALATPQLAAAAAAAEPCCKALSALLLLLLPLLPAAELL